MLRTLTIALASLVVALPVFAQTATYSVTFHATWTDVTHPVEYPAGPHFSGLAVINHDSTVSFWDPGELASPGIELMAETGSRTTINQEYNAAISAGSAESRKGIDPLWNVPGSVNFQMAFSTDYPLATLVCMIAPSPDWFVGVSGLDLRSGNGWVNELVVDLYPYDAGTDNGPSYSQPDQPTLPPEAIYLITEGPFTPGVPLGSFTFSLVGISDVPEAPAFQARAYPNPFNPRTTIAWDLPQAGEMRVEIRDGAGRLVKALHLGQAGAGSGQVTWNGKDSSGRNAAAGIYFAQIKAGELSKSVKITLVK